MVTPTPWDVRVCNGTNLAVIAYVPQWESVEFADSIQEFGHGSLSFDQDEQWISDFKTAEGKNPWEGNYAVQVLRAGTVIYTFLIEESEIEYAGTRRRVVIGGRGLAACLTWSIVLPEGFNEAAADPDDPDTVIYMNRGFGNTGTEAELEAGTYSVDNPHWKGYGGGAFVHLFHESDTGNAGSWADVTDLQASRNGAGIDWPLSLSANLTRTNDSNNNAWSHTGYYPSLDTTWLFEIPSGMNLHDALLECCSKQANSQWTISPTGVISIGHQIGTDKSGTILLTVPSAVSSANQLTTRDLRSRIYATNGFVFESRSDATATTNFGRREGFIDTDQAKGQTVGEAAGHALEEVKDTQDEFTFAYVETDTTRAFLDYSVGDSVAIEYEPGVTQTRQISGLAASINAGGASVEIVVGDIVDNAIAKLEKKLANSAYSAELTSRMATHIKRPKNVDGKKLDPPLNLTATPLIEGLIRAVVFNWDTPTGMEAHIHNYEIETWRTGATSQIYSTTKLIDRAQTAQNATITGLGTKDATYYARARSVGATGTPSEWCTQVSFTMTTAEEGGASDPLKPATISGIVCFPMLNGVLVKFTDLNDGANISMQGNRGKYEIQVNNASGSNWTSGSTWQRTIGSSGAAGESGGAPKTFTVPSGDGFVCTGLISTASPGTVHYVRVRGVNWDGTVGDWASGPSVALDKDNESQVGVWIGEDSITANHILASTITATEIASGTIKASNIDSGEIMTSAIVLPQPSGDNADGSSYPTGDAMKMNIDHDGNIWWGDFLTHATAVSRTLRSASGGGTAAASYVASRIKGDGTEVWFGNETGYLKYISTYNAVYASNLIVEGASYLIDTVYIGDGSNPTVVALSANTSLTVGPMYATNTYVRFGASSNYITASSTADTDFGFTGYSLKFGSSSGGTQFGAVKGGETNIDLGFGSITRRSIQIGNQLNYGLFATYGNTAGYGAFIAARSSTANISHLGLSAYGNVDLTSSNGWFSINADQGIEIDSKSQPSSTANKLWNDSGTLTWGTTAIGGGAFYWNLKDDAANTAQIGPGTEDVRIVGGTDIDTSLSGNWLTVTHESGNGKNHIPAGGSSGQILEYASAGTAAWTSAGSGTVTSVATTGAITGGTITTTGTIAHSTSAGYKHIPAGGSSGQILEYAGSSGTAQWAAASGGGGDYTWSVNVPSGTANEVDDGDTIVFQGLGIASTTMGGNTVNITATKNITTNTSTGRKGMIIGSGTATSTSVDFELNAMTNTAVWDKDNSFITYGIAAFGTNYHYRTSVEQFADFLSGLDHFNEQFMSMSYDKTYTNNSIWNGSSTFANFTLSGTGVFISGSYASFYKTEHNGFQVNTLGTLMHAPTKGITQYHVNGTTYQYQIFTPLGDATYTLGTSGYRWSTTYTTGISTSSDQALKTDIVDEAKGVDFLKTLRPITFKWKSAPDEVTGVDRAGIRDHHGFIAQDVETALGADAATDALWYHGHHPATAETLATTPEGEEYVAIPAQDESYNPGLRYLEFVGPIVKAIQELATRVEALEGS